MTRLAVLLAFVYAVIGVGGVIIWTHWGPFTALSAAVSEVLR